MAFLTITVPSPEIALVNATIWLAPSTVRVLPAATVIGCDIGNVLAVAVIVASAVTFTLIVGLP